MCQGSPAGEPAAAAAEPPAAGAAAAVKEHATAAGAAGAEQQPAASSQQQDGAHPSPQQQQQGSKLSAGTASGSGKAGRRSGGGGSGSKDGGGGEESKVQVACKEVVGRQVAVWSARLGDWPKAAIAQYNPSTQQHLVRYLERAPGEVKHHEEWVHLARTRFQWLTDPLPGASPNPTYATAPRGEEAVHCKVRVFWPGMCRWYTGKIVSYDAKSRKHKVRYRDGDTQELLLRNEAVQYLDKEAPPTRVRTDARRKGGTAANGGGGGSAKKAAGIAGGSLKKRAREGSAGMEGDSVSGGGGGDGGGASAEQRNMKSQKGVGGTPVAAPATASPPKDAVAGSHDVSAVMGDSEEGGHLYSEGGLMHSDDLPSSSGMASEEDLGSEVFISEGEMMMGEEEEEDSDFEVESYRSRRRNNGAGGGRAGGGAGRSASRRSGGARSGAGRRRSDGRRVGGGVRRPSTGGSGRPRSGAGARGGGARREPAAPRVSAAFRKVLRADEETIKVAGAGIVGARVSVFWHADENYYKGKLVQFDGYHKRHKVVYDDGDEEWASLPRESFRWLTPRARSAGCTPDFRHLMQQLGAEDCGAPGAGGVSTRRQAHASGGGGAGGGGEAAPPEGDACVGWQVSLLFDGDGQWYRGEVVGWDPRRGRALLLYDDGEDEWVELGREELTWHCQLAGHSGVYPGLPKGPAPAGSEAVGWRIAVYWPADQAFYPGEIVGFDPVSGRHDVAYDDGEEGPVNLGVDRVKWVLAPGAAVDREKLEAAEVGAGRGRRRGGDDSDPDYEVLEYRPRAPPRRSMQRLMSDGLSPAPTPMGGAAGMHPWDLAAGAEASLAESAGNAHPSRYLSLPYMRAPQGPAAAAAAAEAAQSLGPPLVVRQLTRAVGLASLNGGGPDSAVTLPQPVTVRIYMSSTANSNGSATSADTALGAAPAAGAAQPPAPRPQGAARLQARLHALQQMSRRVSKAQQTIVKGVPTPLPSRKAAAAEAARVERGGGAGGAGVTSPTAAQRQQALLLGSSHASGLHRLARGSAVNYSPFHHKRPHPADSEASSSSGSSDEENEDGDMGADSAEARQAGRIAAAGGGADPSNPGGLPLSPRCIPKGGKIKPLSEQEALAADLAQQEGSTLSDLLTSGPAAMGQQSPAILSPFKPAPACPPVDGGGLGSGLVTGRLLPPPLPMGVALGEGALAGMPHSSSLAGGMDALLMPLPVGGLARGDSMVNLMAGHGLALAGVAGLPDSRNTSGMLGGNSGLLGLGSRDDLDDTGTGGAHGAVGAGVGDLLGMGGLQAHAGGIALDALQQEGAAP